MRILATFICAYILIAWTSVSKGALILQVAVNDVVASSPVNVQPGDSFSFDIYLTETDASNELSTIGLREFRLSASIDDPSFAAAVSAVRASSFESHNGFQSNTTVVNSSTLRFGGLGDQSDPAVGVFPDDDGVADRSVLLGTGEYQVANNASGDALLVLDPTASPLFLPFNLADQNGNTFDDGLSIASTSLILSVAAVPEPSTLLGLAVTFAAIGVYRRKEHCRSTLST